MSVEGEQERLRQGHAMEVELLKGEVSIMHLKPGDTLVLKVDRCLSRIALQHLNDAMKRAFPTAENVAILEEGYELHVVKGEDKGGG